MIRPKGIFFANKYNNFELLQYIDLNVILFKIKGVLLIFTMTFNDFVT